MITIIIGVLKEPHHGFLNCKFLVQNQSQFSSVVLFTGNFFQLHYNAIQHGYEAISGRNLNYKIAQKVPHILVGLLCNVNEKVNCEKAKELFQLGRLLSHYRPCDDTHENFCFHIFNCSMYMCLNE